MLLLIFSSVARSAHMLSTSLVIVTIFGYVFAHPSSFLDAPITSVISPGDVAPGDGDSFGLRASAPPKYKKCRTKNPQFDCLKGSVAFPTVDCLRHDMMVCGVVGPRTIFYSFGARIQDVVPFRDLKDGVMFNDALADEWWLALAKIERFHLDIQGRQSVFVARFAEALASIVWGETFLAIPKERVGGPATDDGAYTIPNDDGTVNVWRFFEFPTLQRNQLVTKITLVDVTTRDGSGKQTFPTHEGWLPNNPNYPELTFEKGHAKDLPVPGVPAPQAAAPKAAPPPHPAAPKAAPPPPPRYATGTCHIHVKEYETCGDDSKNLHAEVVMQDNAGQEIGRTPVGHLKNPYGSPINDAEPYDFTSELPYVLIVTGQHRGDLVQFRYGALSWTSRTKEGPAHCKTGGWDPRSGPICGQRFTNTPSAVRPLPVDLSCYRCNLFHG